MMRNVGERLLHFSTDTDTFYFSNTITKLANNKLAKTKTDKLYGFKSNLQCYSLNARANAVPCQTERIVHCTVATLPFNFWEDFFEISVGQSFWFHRL